MNTSLQARIYDPLWLLARQWQFGEFQGEDNGSPMVARWRAEKARLTRYYAGAIAPNTIASAPRYDGNACRSRRWSSAKRCVRQLDQAAPDKLRLAAEAGQQFLRMLAQQPLSGDYRSAYIRKLSVRLH